MKAPRILEVKLCYGCYSEQPLPFPDHARPIVIHGPNGAGKSTILEGIVRVLYGFNRRQTEDRAVLEQREPWDGTPASGQLTIRNAAGEVWEIERTFESGQVELRRIDPSGERWQGDGNPGADNAQAREYRRRIAELVGFGERTGYEATACLVQGALGATDLGPHLLRLAAGGHGEVEDAKEHIRARFRELTRQPIVDGERPAYNPRHLEQLDEDLETLRNQIENAERAERKRRPLLQEEKELEKMADRLNREVEVLEEAQGPLLERRTLEAELTGVRGQAQGLHDIRDQFETARRSLTDAQDRYQPFAGQPYPTDFLERLGRLEDLWRSGEELDGQVSNAMEQLKDCRIPEWVAPALIGGGVVSLAGVAGVTLGWVALGSVALVMGIAIGLLAFLRRRELREEWARLEETLDRLGTDRSKLDERIDDLLQDIPHRDTLNAQTAPDRRDRFQQQNAASKAMDNAREELRRAVQAAVKELERSGVEVPDVSPSDLNSTADLEEAAGVLASILRQREEEATTDLAAKKLEHDRATPESLSLPEGVEATPQAVSTAIRTRRSELRKVQEDIQAIKDRLRNEGTASESPVALRDRARELEERNRTVARNAEAHAAAFRLLQAAYEEFREQDQGRLLRRVSARMAALTGGQLGPVEATDGLENAQLHAFGRRVPLSSPPLSFGELHAALFAVRLGATDFLSIGGSSPPLLVDEPFAYLDDGHAEAVWSLLCMIAEDRQVIVSTQDRLLIEHLGVRPKIRLQLPHHLLVDRQKVVDEGP